MIMNSSVSMNNSYSKQTNRYDYVDIFRVYCALLVVFIHCFNDPNSLSISNIVKETLTRQAVPYFYIITGFFMVKSLNKQNVMHKIWNILKLYLVWQVLWLPNTILTYLNKYQGEAKIKVLALLFRRLFIAGNLAYWYLLVLVESLLFIYLINCIIKNLKLKEYIYITITVFGLSLEFIYDSMPNTKIHSIFYSVFSWSNNFIMKGVPFLLIGYFIHKYIKLSCLKLKELQICYLVITFTNILLYFYSSGIIAPLYIIQAPLLFIIGVKLSNVYAIPGEKVASKCLEISCAVFFTHQVFLLLYSTIIDNTILNFFLTIISSIVTYIVFKTINFRPYLWMINVKYFRKTTG